MEINSESLKSALPDNWVLVRHEDIATINPRFPQNEINDDIEVSFLPMAAVEELSGKFSLGDIRKYSEVKKGYTSFKDGDIIFAKITPCMENGKIAVVNNLKNGIGFGSTEFHVSRLSNYIEPKFVFFYLVQASFRHEAKKYMTGTAGQLRVPTTFFKEFLIPIPPLPEQRAIVAKIEQLFSELDNGISSLKKAQEQLKINRQAVLMWAFEGKLTEKWREENRGRLETGGELLKRIKKARWELYEKELQDYKEKKTKIRPKLPFEQPILLDIELFELPQIPKDWAWCFPEEVASPEPYSIGIGPFGSNLKVSDYRKEGIPLIFVRNITKNDFNNDIKYISEEKFEELIPHSVKSLDILITKMGDPPGDCVIYPISKPPAVITSDCLKFRIWDKYVVREFLKYCIESNQTKKQLGIITRGVAQQKISVERFKTLRFPLPSREEQIEITKEVERRLSIIEKIEEVIFENLQKSESLRQSVLKKAFEGSLLSEQDIGTVRKDPKWEPAENLMERIKNAKEKNEVLTQTKNLEEWVIKMEDSKELLTLLKESPGIISAKELWRNSIYKDDIDGFYSELKKLESQNLIFEEKKENESYIGLRHENR